MYVLLNGNAIIMYSLSIVKGDCQAENGWPITVAGGEATKPCEGDTVGYQVRKCNAQTNVWDAVDTQYCLPKNPPYGIGYVDVILYLPNSNPSQIAKDRGAGIVAGFLSYYTFLNEQNVSIHRVVRVDAYASVQLRISADETYAESIYNELRREKGEGEHILNALETYLQHNNSKYRYLTQAGTKNCDIFCAEGPELRGDTSTPTPTLPPIPPSPPSNLVYSPNSFVIPVGHFFSTQTPTVTGDLITFSVASGTLPQGVTLDEETGVISGVYSLPTVLLPLTIRAENPYGSTLTTLTIHCISAPTAFAYLPDTHTVAVGGVVNAGAVVTGEYVTFSLLSSILPAGLSLNPSTGAVTGTPSQSQTSTVTIIAENAAGSTTATLSFTILRVPANLQYSQSVYLVPAGFYFATPAPAVTGDALRFTIQSGSLPTGLQLSEATGVIAGTTSQISTLLKLDLRAENAVGFTTTTLSFLVANTSVYIQYVEPVYYVERGVLFSITPATHGENLRFTLANGTLPMGLSLHSETGTIAGIPTQSTSMMSLEVLAENTYGSMKTVVHLQVLQAPSALHYPQSQFSIKIDEAFSTTPSVEGDALEFELTSGWLPSGLVLDETTGVISGTPAMEVDEAVVEITAFNKIKSVKAQLVFTVKSSYLIIVIVVVLVILIVLVVVCVLVCCLKKKKKLPVKKHGSTVKKSLEISL